MLQTPLGRFRVVAALEGLSFVGLLFIAMPFKYLAGQPLGVRIVGMAHGLLFVAYLYCLYETATAHGWPKAKVAWALVAALLPFGPLVFDARLRRAAQAER